ncbi:MAG: DUF1924 domain-containing protein [Azonexus sp.]|nr:DUF1924 domain-containing protein [Azonexus sp.]
MLNPLSQYMPAALLGILVVLPAQAAGDPVTAPYAAELRAVDPGFSGFSTAQGQALYRGRFTGGKPDTPSCTTCHGDNPRQPGRSLTGKALAPMASTASPARYADPAKVEKWFGRNCREVLGRECTPREKGDWLSYVRGQ